MASVYEIVQGLSQAAANAYDGALNEDGEPVLAGLQREEVDPILDKRVMDGFGVKFFGNMMCLSYQADVFLKEVYATGFESDIEQKLADIVSFLKKEYQSITGKSVSLTLEGEVDVMVQSTSNIRSWVQAKQHYKIGGLSEDMNNQTPSKRGLEDGFKEFLDQGGFGSRPSNDKRPKSKND